MLREILNDEFTPNSFLQSIAEGINHTLLAELQPDLIKLSTRIDPVSNYVTRYRILAEKFKDRNIEFDLDLKRKKSKQELEYNALTNRFLGDDEQLLRSELDITLESLSSAGNEESISKLLDEGKVADHLIYDMYYRDREAFKRLKLKQLNAATSGH